MHGVIRCLAAAGLSVAVVVIAACGPASPAATASPTIEPTATAAPAAASPPAPPTSPATSATGACVDVAALADAGDPVENALQTIDSELAAQKVTDARATATTAAAGLRAIGSSVADASPAAATQFAAAADELDHAAAAFPGGADLLAKAKADFDTAFSTARDSACP